MNQKCVTNKRVRNLKSFMTVLQKLCKRNQTWDELEGLVHQQPLLQMQRKQLLILAATSSSSSSLVFLLPLPLVLLLKVPLLPPFPCSNQANLAPLPSSLTSSPAYTTLQSPDFKRNLKFRSSEILPLTKYKYPPISHPRLQRMKCQVPIWKFEAPPLSENVKKALDEGKGGDATQRYTMQQSSH